MSLITFVNEAKNTDHLQSSDFGLPATRKFPMSNATQVKMATVHFSKCKDANKAELARNIVKKAKEHGVTIHNEEILKWAGVSKEEGKSKTKPTEQHPNLTRLDNLRKTLPQSEHSKLDIIKDLHDVSPDVASKHLDKIESKKEEPKVKSNKFDESKLPKGVKLTGETIKYRGVTLHQLEFDGMTGGYIEKPENISGNARVLGDAKVYGDAQVLGYALISGEAEVSERATVYGNAQVNTYAKISGNAEVYGDVVVKGRSKVTDNAQVYEKANVRDRASIGGNAKIHGKSQIFGEALVFGDSNVSGDEKVFGDKLYNK